MQFHLPEIEPPAPRPNRAIFSSASEEWSTPAKLYAGLNEEFNFNFDPCPLGGTVDGTKMDWSGLRVFCNPPYGRGILPFLRRALEAEVAVYLLPSKTDLPWFHDIVLPLAKEVRYVRGRLKFGGSMDNAPFSSMIVIFGGAAVVN